MKIVPWQIQHLDKRQMVPFTITDNCPKCGWLYNSDERDYLGSYLKCNMPVNVELYCPECDDHWIIKLIITMNIEEAK